MPGEGACPSTSDALSETSNCSSTSVEIKEEETKPDVDPLISGEQPTNEQKRRKRKSDEDLIQPTREGPVRTFQQPMKVDIFNDDEFSLNLHYDNWLSGNSVPSTSRESSCDEKYSNSPAEQPAHSNMMPCKSPSLTPETVSRSSLYVSTRLTQDSVIKIPRMELVAKVETIEDEEVANQMIKGHYHPALYAMEDVVQRFPNFPVRNFKNIYLYGEFNVKSLIAVGSNSLVYNATDLKGSEYAIKVSHVEENINFLDKLNSIGTSRHILKPFITERLSDQYFLTVSNIINIDLEHLRKIGNFALLDSQIMDVLTQVGNGLAEIHNMGFIHADICPANILLAGVSLYGEGEHILIRKVHCLVTDFNSVMQLNNPDMRQRVGIIQQAAYRAPEVLLGLLVGPKADVFSLGIIGLDMVCPGHWTLEEYDVTDPMKLGEHLYRLDRQVYSICWKIFEECLANGMKEVYYAYNDFYKKRLKLKFPVYECSDLNLVALVKTMIAIDPEERISSQDLAKKHPVVYEPTTLCPDVEAIPSSTPLL